ncbi:MAG: hypothetical protein ACO22Z_03970 [Paracoccaceae bacterium]
MPKPRFPTLAPQEPITIGTGQAAPLRLSLSLIPLPIGEVSVLITGWLLVMPS